MCAIVLLLALAPETAVRIPEGSFPMGDADMPDTRPVRPVTVSAFAIDRAEVSIDAFEAFVKSDNARCWSTDGTAWRKSHPNGAGPLARAAGRAGDHPVVAVSYWEAEAYCSCAGGSLPTEAQWERAACGVEPRPAPPAENSGVGWWYEHGKYGNLPGVDTHATTAASPPNHFGLVDIFGNVWEWTRDTYRADAYARLPANDPVDTQTSLWNSVRGGSYMNLPSYAGCAHREPVRRDEPRLTVGFRCVYP